MNDNQVSQYLLQFVEVRQVDLYWYLAASSYKRLDRHNIHKQPDLEQIYVAHTKLQINICFVCAIKLETQRNSHCFLHCDNIQLSSHLINLIENKSNTRIERLLPLAGFIYFLPVLGFCLPLVQILAFWLLATKKNTKVNDSL